jgi:hypothetical protein
MEEKTDDTSKRGSFWKTLPGILTAIASLLTASAGFVAVILPIVRECRERTKPDITTAQPPVPIDIPQPVERVTTPLSATADERTYTILSGHREPYSPSEYKLVLEMRIRCKGPGVDFEERFFRLNVDGTRWAPKYQLSNKWITDGSDGQEAVSFIVPIDSRALSLLVGDSATEKVSRIQISQAQLAKWPMQNPKK